MDTLSNIVNRPPQGPHDVPEMEFVVAEYIRATKNKTVVVNICKGIPIPMDELGQAMYIDQVKKLSYAFNGAVQWFLKNPDKL